MIFVSYWFIAFAAAFFPLYWLVRNSRIRLAVLALGSVVFHGHFAGAAGVIPIVILGVVTYLAALSRNKLLCVLGMCLSAAALIFYKYTFFLSVRVLGAASESLGTSLFQAAQPIMPATPPLAISFFVFVFVHYL